jgi:rubrerythrin
MLELILTRPHSEGIIRTMSATQQFDSIEQILDFAIDRERKAQEIYYAFARATERKSFARLLLTMADMEKEHERRLAELKGRRAWASAFGTPARESLAIEEPFKEIAFSPDMDYGDFLVLVIHKEEEAEKLYLRLESLASAAETRRLFRHLAGEERKHRDWAQERYDADIRRDN